MRVCVCVCMGGLHQTYPNRELFNLGTATTRIPSLSHRPPSLSTRKRTHRRGPQTALYLARFAAGPTVSFGSEEKAGTARNLRPRLGLRVNGRHPPPGGPLAAPYPILSLSLTPFSLSARPFLGVASRERERDRGWDERDLTPGPLDPARPRLGPRLPPRSPGPK